MNIFKIEIISRSGHSEFYHFVDYDNCYESEEDWIENEASSFCRLKGYGDCSCSASLIKDRETILEIIKKEHSFLDSKEKSIREMRKSLDFLQTSLNNIICKN